MTTTTTVVVVADVQKARGVEQGCGGGFEGGDLGGGQEGRLCRASSDAVRGGRRIVAHKDVSPCSIRRVISQGGGGCDRGGAPRRRLRFLQPLLPASSPAAADDGGGGGSHDSESSHRHDGCPHSCTSEGKGRIHVPFPPRRRRRRRGSSKSFRARLSSLLLGSLGLSLDGSGAAPDGGAAAARVAAALCAAMAMAVALLFLLLLLLLPALSARSDLTRPSRAPFVASVMAKGRSSGGSGNPPLYRPSDSVVAGGWVGDRSPRYAQIRQAIDERLPLNDGRTRARMRELADPRKVPRQSYLLPEEEEDGASPGQPSYRDVWNCPATPPDGYPFEWSLVEILDRWNIDDIDNVPSRIYQSLCVFDYSKDMDKILAYRDAEAPFVVENDPGVTRTAERWNVPGYLDALLDGFDARRSCEQSRSNHFLFYRPHLESGPEDATAITAKVPARRIAEAVPDGMTYREWRERADAMEKVVAKGSSHRDQPHHSLRLTAYGADPMRQMLLRRKKLQGGLGDKSKVLHEPLEEYLFDELPFFRPRSRNSQDDRGDRDAGGSLYLANATAQHGIYCRFGMAGTVADSHFDLGRNAVAVLRGSRRYIVSRPEQCRNLALFPRDHPSGRHSQVDWSDPHRELATHPEFQRAKGSEVVVSAGQVLWLPSLYFHTIVSLDTTIQCNTRSGDPPSALETFRRCGF